MKFYFKENGLKYWGKYHKYLIILYVYRRLDIYSKV